MFNIALHPPGPASPYFIAQRRKKEKSNTKKDHVGISDCKRNDARRRRVVFKIESVHNVLS